MKFSRAIAVAAFFHAAIFAFFPRAPRRGSAPQTSTPRDADEAWEVAVEAPLEAARASQPAARLDRIDESRTPRMASRDLGEVGRKAPAEDSPTTAAPTPPPAPAWAFSPTPAPTTFDLRLGRPLFTQSSGESQGRSASGHPAAEAQQGAGEAGPRGSAGGNGSTILRDGLHAADVAKGRAIGNPILAIAHNVTMQEPSPVVGDVVFEARIDGNGHVVDVHITSCEGDPKAWEAVKRGLLVALQDRPLEVIGSASRGVLIAFAIKTRWALPSSQGPGVEIGLPLLPGIKTSKGAKDPARIDLMILPRGRQGGESGKLDVTVGTNIDPTNVGASPMRTVSTRIVAEKLL